MTNGKDKVLKEALGHIEKQFGKGSIMRMGDNTNIGQVNTFHTGSYLFDMVLGGGMPEGRIVEIYGHESTGKTLITLQVIAELQKRGETCAFVDAEHALDPAFARMLGVDTDNLLLAQPDYGEQALSITQELAKTGAVKCIVVDSVSALVPRAEVEGEMGDSFVGLQARMMSQGLRKLTSTLAKTGTTVIFINQIRMKIGVMYGNPETTSGGHALKFFASQRLEVRKGEKIMEGKEQTGYNIKIKVAKNKIAPPFKKAELPVRWNVGYDKVADIIEAGLLLKSIDRAGAYYSVGDHKVQGKANLAEALEADVALRDQLEKQIQTAIKKMRQGESVLDEDAIDALEAGASEEE